MMAPGQAETCCFSNTLLINQLCLTYIVLNLLLHTQRGCLNLRLIVVIVILRNGIVSDIKIARYIVPLDVWL